MPKPRTPLASKRSWSFDLLMIPYIVIVVALLAIGAQLWVLRSRMDAAIPSNAYQAVFLTNGQVYFGKLHTLNRGYMVLTDVYYLQEELVQAAGADDKKATTSSTDAAAQDTQLKIIRLGEEIHQPQNGMVISRDHILYWENLVENSRIVDAIAKEKEQRDAGE